MSSEPISGLPPGTPADTNLLVQSTGAAGETQKITEAQFTEFVKGKIIDVGLGEVAVGLVDGTLAGFSAFSYDAGAQKVVMENARISLFLQAGVVHNDTSGNLTSSLIVSADVDPTFVSGTNHGDLVTDVISTSAPNDTGMFMIAGGLFDPQKLQLCAATAAYGGVLTAGAQTIGGDKTFAGNISAANLLGTNTGNVTLNSVGVSSNAAGAQLIGQVLELEPASASFPGVVTTGTQSFAGNKTFSGTISASNLSNTNTGDISLLNVGVTPNSAGMSLSAQVLNLQPADGSNPGALTEIAQTIGGTKTFNVAPILSSLTASTALTLNSSKNISSSATTSTELGYVSGVTSAIQTQLDGKQASGNYITALSGDIVATGPGSAVSTIQVGAVTGSKIAATTITNANISTTADIAASKLAPFSGGGLVLATNSVSKRIQESTTPSAQLFYLNNVTSDIQTQIDSKQATISTANVDTSTANATGINLIGAQLSLTSATASFPGVVTTGTQSFAGAKTFTGAISASNLSGTNTGNITVTAVGSSPNANGSTLTGQALNLEPASGSSPGVVTGLLQTFSGIKQFNLSIRLLSLTTSRALVIDGSNNVTTSSITDTALATLNQTANQVLLGNGASGITSSVNLTFASNLLTVTGGLTVTSTTQPFLPPQMTTTQKNLISTEGAVIYDVTLHKLCVRGVSGWETITSV